MRVTSKISGQILWQILHKQTLYYLYFITKQEHYSLLITGHKTLFKSSQTS